jgi:hypothetical protein
MLNVGREQAVLERMTVKQLRQRYIEVFGEETNGHNKVWLVRRILWRLQALNEGGLSERALRLAGELANDADLRLNPPRVRAAPLSESNVCEVPFAADDRLPPPGTILTRLYKGESVRVRVLAQGFEFEGEVYPSLSAAAKRITGTHCNGYQFFKLTARGGDE